MRKNNIVLLSIILIVLIVFGYFLNDPDAGQQVLVDLGLATPVLETYRASGLIEADSTVLSTINGGRILSLTLPEGSNAQKGDILAILDTESLEIQWRIARAQLEVAKAQLAIVMEGAREVDLAVAQAQKDLAEAIFAGSTQFLKDAQALERTDPSKDLQIALAMAQIETAEANLAVAKQFADELSGLPRREDMESAQAAVQASQATLRQVELQIKQQQIMAPYDGTILNHLVSLSELVQPGWPVLSFSNLGRLSVSVFVPQGDLNWVKVGQTVKVEFDSTTGANMIGNVVHIKDQAEFTPRNIQTPDERSILVHKVTVEVANPDDSLRPGLYADVIFEEPS